MGGVWGWMGVVWVVRGGCGRSVGVDGCRVWCECGKGMGWVGVRSVGVAICFIHVYVRNGLKCACVPAKKQAL